MNTVDFTIIENLPSIYYSIKFSVSCIGRSFSDLDRKTCKNVTGANIKKTVTHFCTRHYILAKIIIEPVFRWHQSKTERNLEGQNPTKKGCPNFFIIYSILVACMVNSTFLRHGLSRS